MSCSRLALRLAAVEALSPAAVLAAGPYPTVAGPRVYDSRIDLLDAAESPEEVAQVMRGVENQPLLSIYTEEQETIPYGDAKYPAAENVVTLVVEAMIASSGVMDIEEPGGAITQMGAINAPITDRQREAVLDILEAQVRRILDRKNRAPSAALLSEVAIELRKVDSRPLRAADRALHFAARTIKFDFKVKSESWPLVEQDPEPTGFDRFPEPLATIAKGLLPGSSGYALCASIAAMMPTAAPLPPALTEIRVSDLTMDGEPIAPDNYYVQFGWNVQYQFPAVKPRRTDGTGWFASGQQ